MLVGRLNSLRWALNCSGIPHGVSAMESIIINSVKISELDVSVIY